MASKLVTLIIIAAILAICTVAVSLRASQREARTKTLYPPVGQILDVDGTPVHVLIDGTGPDLVLLHGAGGNIRDMSFDLLGRLRDRYRVVIFDRPGLGYTGHVPGAEGRRNESPQEQARLLRAAAKQIGVTKPIVLGHSYGGAVAMAWALEDPEDVSALVILAGATMPWEGPIKASYRVYANPISGTLVVPLITAFVPDWATRKVMENIFSPQPVPDGFLENFGMQLTLRRDTMVTNARQVDTLLSHLLEMSKDYSKITVPVELVHGTADTIVELSVHSEPLAALLPDARLTVLEGVGHMPQHAAPAEVVAAIDRAAQRAGLQGTF